MRNPKWHRDEIILALDLYFDKQLGPMDSGNPKIIALSELLNKMPIFDHKPDQQTFRNPNGVTLKLSNFKALDPNYTGKGMKAYSKLDREIFEEFSSDNKRLHQIANEIRQAINNPESSNEEVRERDRNNIEAKNKKVFKAKGEPLSASQLKRKFIDAFSNVSNFKYKDGNPFKIRLYGRSFHIFLKHISPAYYGYNPDIHRIQLPYRDQFIKLAKSSIPFIALGYDTSYDTFTSWDPSLIKGRLNKKSNVSLFTRESFQEKVRKNKFKEHQISNGDKVIVFSRRSLPLFIKNYTTLFNTDLSITKIRVINRDASRANKRSGGRKHSSARDKIIGSIGRFRKKNDLIGAVLYCSKKYQSEYPKMSIKNWTRFIMKFFHGKSVVIEG
jgi:hypothetical protein